jgi:hypothetical protein
MSVAPISADELGTFAAIVTKLDVLSLPDALKLCEVITAGNVAAWADTYSDRIDPADIDDIERAALAALVTPSLMLRPFGPLVYNMVSNPGRYYEAVYGQPIDDQKAYDQIRGIEQKAKKWQAAEARSAKRAEQDAKSFADCPQLTTQPMGEIVADATSKGYQRVIVAEFRVCESDPHTDYHGSRTVRRVVIGYGKGKRESFAQLRKAAANFGPTMEYGPGLDVVKVFAHTADKATREREYSPSEPLRDEKGQTITFTTAQAARDHVDGMVMQFNDDVESGVITYPRVCQFIDYAASIGYEVRTESIEHRETYSMGRGNYLGLSGYSGWVVRSSACEWSKDSTENVEVFATNPKPAKRNKTTPKKTPSAEIVETVLCEKTARIHGVNVQCGKRSAYIAFGRIDQVSIYLNGPRRNNYGKHFSSFSDACEAYSSESIKRMLNEALAELDRYNAAKAKTASQPKPVSPVVDQSEINALAWL